MQSSAPSPDPAMPTPLPDETMPAPGALAAEVQSAFSQRRSRIRVPVVRRQYLERLPVAHWDQDLSTNTPTIRSESRDDYLSPTRSLTGPHAWTRSPRSATDFPPGTTTSMVTLGGNPATAAEAMAEAAEAEAEAAVEAAEAALADYLAGDRVAAGLAYLRSASTRAAEEPNTKLIDYEELEYVDKVDPSLLCPICLRPFNKAVTTQKCGHTFCEECLFHSVWIKCECPMDGQLLLSEDQWVPAREVNEQVGRLRVACPNPGCETILARESLEAHCEEECEWAMVPCQAERTKQLPRQTSGARVKVEKCGLPVPKCRAGDGKECLHTTTTCPYCGSTDVVEAYKEEHFEKKCPGAMRVCKRCGCQVVRHKMEYHLLLQCSERDSTCKWRIYGCRIEGRKSIIDEHEKGCAFQALCKDIKKVTKERDELQARVKRQKLGP